jgi:hypothetical protein
MNIVNEIIDSYFKFYYNYEFTPILTKKRVREVLEQAEKDIGDAIKYIPISKINLAGSWYEYPIDKWELDITDKTPIFIVDGNTDHLLI